MHRQPLIELLDAYEALWPDEQAAGSVRALVEQHADCFDRSCRPGHVTGSAWVVSHDGERHLLLHHRKLDKWLQPGGHADGDPDVAAVALREAQEESGLVRLRLVDPVPLDLDVHLIPARHDSAGRLVDDAHEHHDVRFLFRCEAKEPLVVSDESNEVRWFTPTELRQQTDERSVLRLLDKALNRGL